MIGAPSPSLFDIAGLESLQARAAQRDPQALAEVAVQFEALFIGLLLDSARDAGSGGIFDSPQTQQYLELMDRQVALDLARRGAFGIGKMLIEQIEPGAAADGESAEALAALSAHRAARASERAAAAAPLAATPEEFVARFAADATAAAKRLGVEPRVLLAQAALETGWGAAAPRHVDGRQTHNLFGMKAGGSWDGDRAWHTTLENVNGVAERKRALFRSYSNGAASFADYADLIATAPRYAAALEQAHDAAGYVRAVSAAGYATDPAYADKWLAIYDSERLKDAFAKVPQ